MKRRGMIVAALLTFGLLAVFAYYSNYELRLVPNKPHLRPKVARPEQAEAMPKFALEGGSERDTRGFPQRDIVDLVSQFPKLYFREGNPKKKQVALTFDDGPDSVYTPQMLDVLGKHGVKATFFLIGNRAELFPDVIKRIVQEGHVVGNHTMTHPDILKLTHEQTRQNISQAEETLAKLIEYRTALFRSPYGSLDPERIREIEKLGYKIIAWNVDSLDWKSLTAEQVKYNILENAKEGSIILQHSAGGKEENLSGSVEALNDIITELKSVGYSFLTIPELLNLPYRK